MKTHKVIIIACLAFFSQKGISQDVYRRYDFQNGGLDLKLSYVANANSEFTGNNLYYRATFVKNYILLPGDGIKDPVIGLSLNPTLGYAATMRDVNQAPYTLMLDGLISFVPSLYLRVLPEVDSRFTLYAFAAGGAKGFPGFDNISPSSGNESDQNSIIHGQWVFDVGGGFDFDKKFSLFFKYSKGWNDFNSRSARYFRTYVEPSTTFQRYFNIRGNFRLTNGLAAFADWSGYYRSFHNESTTQLGLAVCIKCGRNKNKANEKLGAGKRDDLANRIESIKARLGSIDTKVLDGTMKSNLLTKLDDLKNRAAIAKDKEEYLQILKELEGITKEIRNNKNIDEKIRRKENQLD